MTDYKTILHPTDFSDRAQNAFRLASTLASQHQAKLIVVHVAPVPTPPVVPYGGSGVPEMSPEITDEELHTMMDEIRSMNPHADTEYLLVKGKISDQILRVADEHQCDVIVMGTHGRGRLERLLMGSVAESVLRKAKCPVITVKEPFDSNVDTDEETAAKQTGAAE